MNELHVHIVHVHVKEMKTFNLMGFYPEWLLGYMYICTQYTKGYVHESTIHMIRRERGEEINIARERDREGDEGREGEMKGGGANSHGQKGKLSRHLA